MILLHVLFSHDDRCRELDIVVHDPDATVADLVEALSPGRPDLTVEAAGRRLDPTRRLLRCGMTEASIIRLVSRQGNSAGCSGDGLAATTGLRLDVVGGLDSGHRFMLRPGLWTLGRTSAESPAGDHRTIRSGGAVPKHHAPSSSISLLSPTVSTRHADLGIDPGGVTISDRGSANGTWIGDEAVTATVGLPVDQTARLGAVQVALRIDDVLDRHRGPAHAGSGTATVPFNRPPRPEATTVDQEIEPPAPPKPPSGGPGIGVVAVLAPLLFGAVMVKVFGNLMFGLFALLGPVMMIGNAVEGRRRGKGVRRREQRRFDADLRSFEAALGSMAAQERSRLDAALPDPAEVLRRVELPSTRLWERRPGHPDSRRLRAGLGPVPWAPPVGGQSRQWAPEVREAVGSAAVMQLAPVEVDLGDGGVVGIIGPRAAALALARSLVVQAAAHHGPADLPVAVVTRSDRRGSWDWAKWLPHVICGSGRRMLAAEPEAVDSLLRGLLDQAPEDDRYRPLRDPGRDAGPALLLVVDDEGLTEARRSPARSILRGLAGPVAGVVIASSEEHLPASCTTVIELLDEDGTAVVHRPGRGETVPDVLACGITEQTARRAARAMARFDDPEVGGGGAGLPTAIGLLPLLDLHEVTAESLLAQWHRDGDDPAATTPLGIGQDGTVEIDLDRDGPHGLVAGTTGAGKSELLRTLVAGLAARSSPDHVTFLLVDFKGGSAFDRCAGLPHTVGLITDLDQRLAERALRCLEAELRYREQVLRASGSSDLGSHRRQSGTQTLPRLVVVIDEFATLKSELPDFVDALVSVAQRGRSLGVHLILATQRPAGAVSENIKANTNLRIALRVQDAADSSDVIDRPDAARIGRDLPGRALVRLGPGEVVALQTALSTGITGSLRASVEARPFSFGMDGTSGSAPVGAGPSDLDRLVDAAAAAHVLSGRPDPRPPWPDPLVPDAVPLEELTRGERRAASALDFAIADDPDHQRQFPVGWQPSAGPLLLIGMGATGTTTAATSVALAAASMASPDDLHIHALDLGGGLQPLDKLPHTGSVVAAGDRERQVRLVGLLRDEVATRRAEARRPGPEMLVLVDGIAALRSEWGDVLDELVDDLVRVAVEGTAVGVHVVVTADRTGALPRALLAASDQRLVFRLVDDLEAGAANVQRRDLASLPVGGAIHSPSGLVVQVARPATGIVAAVAAVSERWPARPHRPPVTVGAMPDLVATNDLPPPVADGPTWQLPIGIGYHHLTPVGFELHEGEHALVAGPARSGRTTTLMSLAAAVAQSAPHVLVVAVAGRRSALAGISGATVFDPADLEPVVARIDEARHRPVLVLVDDADRIEDGSGVLSALLAEERPGIHMVAAGRAEALRSLYGHWTRHIRASRVGLLLQPDADIDGELLGTRLPRRPAVPIRIGRGYLVGPSGWELTQVQTSVDMK